MKSNKFAFNQTVLRRTRAICFYNYVIESFTMLNETLQHVDKVTPSIEMVDFSKRMRFHAKSYLPAQHRQPLVVSTISATKTA